MNYVKSVFIGVYPMLAMGIAGYSTWQLVVSRDLLTWAGPLLTVVPFLLFLSVVMMFQNVARTAGKLPLMNVLALVGLGSSVYASFFRAAPGGVLAFVLTCVGVVTFALYSMWYSRLGREASEVLAPGRKMPALELETAEGEAFSTRELLGRPALIFFYRGNWCPLCMAQIKEVAARYRELQATGARVLLVSPQSHENTAAVAKRFDVPFEFLTDKGGRAARTLRIEMKDGLPMGMGMLGYDPDTVFPTAIILDAEGIVRWVDQTDNYRIRPEPETFLPILRELATT